jgi:hypothetical protein
MQKTTALVEGDVALVYVDNKPAFFVRIERIEPDVKKRWWRVRFLVLAIPLTATTWIIDEEQIRGAEFTMSGTPIRIEKVVAPETGEGPTAEESTTQSKEKKAKEGAPEKPEKRAHILSLEDRMKEGGGGGR